MWMYGISPAWADTLKSLVHNPCIVRSSSESFLVSRNTSMTPVLLPYNWRSALVDAGTPDVKSSSEALLGAVMKGSVTVSSEKQDMLDDALDLLEAIFPTIKTIPITVWDDSNNELPDPETIGISALDKIFIRESCFESKSKLLFVLTHEATHHVSRAGDLTPEFERALVGLVIDALLLYTSS